MWRGRHPSNLINRQSKILEYRCSLRRLGFFQQYLGQGVVQYSIDINFTLTIMPQRDSYYHHTFITARVLNACKYIYSCSLLHSSLSRVTFHWSTVTTCDFKLYQYGLVLKCRLCPFKVPPEITAQCSDGGITFSVVRLPRAESLWEVGVDHEPLTSQLADQRGYHLYNDSHRTTLEIPVFSIGYTYEVRLQDAWGPLLLGSAEITRKTVPELVAVPQISTSSPNSLLSYWKSHVTLSWGRYLGVWKHFWALQQNQEVHLCPNLVQYMNLKT